VYVVPGETLLPSLLKVVPNTPLTYRLPLRYTSYDVAPDDADHVNTIRGLLPEQPGDALVMENAPGALTVLTTSRPVDATHPAPPESQLTCHQV
jgi:hypothetical protein